MVGLVQTLKSSKLGNARLVAGVFILALLSGCASFFPQTKELAKGWPQELPKQVELTEVPFFPQLEYQCGPAALATVLVSAGVKTTPNDLVPQVYIPERKGSLQVEMLAAARRHGLVSYALAPRFEDVLREIAAGTPVIVLQNLGLFSAGWHYAVAVGYDYGPGTLVLRSGTLERDVVPFAAHEVVWMRSGYWAMVAVPPERIPATAEEKSWLNAIAALRARRRRDAPRASPTRRSSAAGRTTSMRTSGSRTLTMRSASWPRPRQCCAKPRGATRSRSWCSTTSRRRSRTSVATRKRSRSSSARRQQAGLSREPYKRLAKPSFRN